MGYTHFDKLSGINGLAVGAKGSEKVIADSLGRLYLNFEPGAQFYVDSVHGSASGDGLTWATAVTTIELAMAKCTANHGDVIWVAPGHNQGLVLTEVDFDIAGISVIGLGTGTLKPTFDYDHANAIVAVGASNITLQNLRFRVSANAVTVGVDIEAGFTGTRILDCEFGYAETASDEFAISMAINVGCDDTVVNGCRFSMGAQAAATGIKLIGASDNVQITNCIFNGNYSLACIAGITTACTNLLIEDNFIFQGSAVAAISLYAGTTGGINRNEIKSGLVTLATAVIAGSCYQFGNSLNAYGNPINTFYVNSVTGADSAGSGSSMGKPTATLDYAVNLASAGDTIYVMEGHNENITTAAQIDLDVAGLKVIGLGTGSRKPTIDFDADAASVAVGANNVTIQNIRFRTSANAVTVGLDIEAGFDNTIVDGCEFGWAETATDEFAIALRNNAGCNETIIRNCLFDAGAQAAVTAISITGASDNIIIAYNRFLGAHSTACINGITTLSTNLLIEKNLFFQGATEPAIELVAASTGIIRDNDIKTNLATMAAAIVSTGTHSYRNYYNETATETGTIIGVAAADDT